MTAPTTVTVAPQNGPADDGQPAELFIWVGVYPGTDTTAWYNWAHAPIDDPHCGTVRHGSDGQSWGKQYLVGDGQRLFFRLLESMPPGMIEELLFDSQLTNKATMFRLKLAGVRDRNRALNLIKAFAREVFPGATLMNGPAMPARY